MRAPLLMGDITTAIVDAPIDEVADVLNRVFAGLRAGLAERGLAEYGHDFHTLNLATGDIELRFRVAQWDEGNR